MEILHFFEVDSTNARAKALALQGHAECVVVAGRQTAGRGRLDRSWDSPAGEGLWTTQLLRPRALPAENAGGAVFVAGLAMAEALSDFAEVRVKWPNDLVLNGKKLSGMLAEAGFEGGVCSWLALGVGVNLLQASFPPELPSATSLFLETGARVTPMELLHRYLDRFAPWYKIWLRDGLSPVLEAIRPLSATLGRRVRIGTREGEAVGFRGDGALLIREGDQVTALVAGDVSVRGLYGYV
ncbi:MAG: biotin--[acetyl-CoA-carboxylase] ligase [Clostridiales bacterium]|nr:biotin--[acetyl-CoA-carboxylase] ligase [Clostridiales bacterium]OPZ69565.1 MAG: Bifunctional ligase/repressor BirA [Firmicutes bacterium ADurb.Bin467]